MASRRRRGRLALILGLIVLVALLWVGYWFAAKTLAETAIARVTTAPAGGQKVGCTGLALGGFPLRLDIRCGRGTYSGPGEDVTAALGGVAVSAPLYWPGYAEATLTAPFEVNAPEFGLALTTSWSAATASVTAGIGGLRGFGASFASLKAENSSTEPSSPFAALSAVAASGGIDPDGNSYALSASTTQLNVTWADGSALPTIDADARLVAIDVGASLGTDPTRTLLDWIRKGGTVNVERLKVAAGGAMVALSGKLTLSPEGLLSGTVLVRYNSIDAVAGLIEAIRPGASERYDVALQGLNAVTMPAETEDGKVRQTTVSFIDGIVLLGIFPLPVDPIPPIRF